MSHLIHSQYWAGEEKKTKTTRCKSETSQYVKQIGQSVRQVLSRGATRASGPEMIRVRFASLTLSDV